MIDALKTISSILPMDQQPCLFGLQRVEQVLRTILAQHRLRNGARANLPPWQPIGREPQSKVFERFGFPLE